jgi:prepilin-type N-terminal cleavage/methylation domain-containing protein
MSMEARKTIRPSTRRGFTLVELMVALLITAILSLAVCTLTAGAFKDDAYLRAAVIGQNEVELATRRMVNNIKEAQTGSITIGTSTLSTLTQADSADGYSSGATVSYALAADATYPTQNDLVETDQRYGSNVLVHNVTTFTVSLVSGYTNLYHIDLVAATQPITERHVQVFGRN